MVAPTLTPMIGGGLSPRIEVVFAPMPGIDRLSITRRVGDRVMKVRGGQLRSAAGGVALLDREAPFGVPSTYRAELFDASGASLGFTDSASLTLNFDGVVVSSPLEPSLWMQWKPLAVFGEELASKQVGSRFLPSGAARPTWVGGRRASVEGVNLSGATTTLADAALFDSMLGTEEQPRIPVLLFRASPQYRIPPVLFAHVEVTQVNVGARSGRPYTRFDIEGAEVEPPAPGLVEPTLTWSDVAAYYETWSEVAADNESWLSLSRRYDLIGLAGQ